MKIAVKGKKRLFFLSQSEAAKWPATARVSERDAVHFRGPITDRHVAQIFEKKFIP